MCSGLATRQTKMRRRQKNCRNGTHEENLHWNVRHRRKQWGVHALCQEHAGSMTVVVMSRGVRGMLHRA